MASSLKTRIWQQALVAVSVIAVLCVMTYFSYDRVAEANRWVAHTQKVLHTVDQLRTALTDAETSQRGYLLTGHGQYLKPYARALQATPAHLQQLAELVSEDTL